MQGKEVHCKENWVVETGGPMSYKRNGFGAVLRCPGEKFVKLRWKPKVVSMVLFFIMDLWHLLYI